MSNPAVLEVTSEEDNEHKNLKEENKIQESKNQDDEIEEVIETSIKTGGVVAAWMKALFNRDDSSKDFNPVWLTTDEYTAKSNECVRACWRVQALPGWKLEKRGACKGDVVESVSTEEFGKVYRFTGSVDCQAKSLHEYFRHNITKVPEWNPTILHSEIIKVICPRINLTYEVTAGGGGGIVAPRDFVQLTQHAILDQDGNILREDDSELGQDVSEPGQNDSVPAQDDSKKKENVYGYISAGHSVEVPGHPHNKSYVRAENKLSCWLIRPSDDSSCIFQWLMCCDLKGRIPQFVLDTAYATVMVDCIKYIRKFVADSKENGTF